MPRSAAAFDLVLNFGQCPLFKRLRSELHALRATAFQAARRRRAPHTQESCPHSRRPAAVWASSALASGVRPPFAQTRRPGPASTARPGIWADAHPLTLECVKPPTTVKTATFRGRRLRRQSSATSAHLGRMTRGCSRTLTRYLSTSMSASVSQLPNGKHSPLSHRNGTYYWQGE